MAESSTPRRIGRRTVARGAAWAVPAVAVAAPAMAMAASGQLPPEPVITFGNACGNTGAQRKGCGGDKTLQVPLTLSNPTASNIVFQITGMFTCNCATAPTAAGAGVFTGVRGIWVTPAHTPVTNQNDCTRATPSTCDGGAPQAGIGGTASSIVVPAGTNAQTYWIESAPTQDSATFSTTIQWRLLDAATCAVLRTGSAQTARAISPQNCDG